MEGTNATLLAACGALAGRVAKLEEVRLCESDPACVSVVCVCGWAAAARSLAVVCWLGGGVSAAVGFWLRGGAEVVDIFAG